MDTQAFGEIVIVRKNGALGDSLPLEFGPDDTSKTGFERIFGSADNCDIRIKKPSIQARHAKLDIRVDQGAWIEPVDGAVVQIAAKLGAALAPLAGRQPLLDGAYIQIDDRGFVYRAPNKVGALPKSPRKENTENQAPNPVSNTPKKKAPQSPRALQPQSPRAVIAPTTAPAPVAVATPASPRGIPAPQASVPVVATQPVTAAAVVPAPVATSLQTSIPAPSAEIPAMLTVSTATTLPNNRRKSVQPPTPAAKKQPKDLKKMRASFGGALSLNQNGQAANTSVSEVSQDKTADMSINATVTVVLEDLPKSPMPAHGLVATAMQADTTATVAAPEQPAPMELAARSPKSKPVEIAAPTTPAPMAAEAAPIVEAMNGVSTVAATPKAAASAAEVAPRSVKRNREVAPTPKADPAPALPSDPAAAPAASEAAPVPAPTTSAETPTGRSPPVKKSRAQSTPTFGASPKPAPSSSHKQQASSKKIGPTPSRAQSFGAVDTQSPISKSVAEIRSLGLDKALSEGISVSVAAEDTLDGPAGPGPAIHNAAMAAETTTAVHPAEETLILNGPTISTTKNEEWEKQLAQREAALEARELAVAALEQTVAAREKECAAWEARLQAKEAAIGTTAAAVPSTPIGVATIVSNKGLTPSSLAVTAATPGISRLAPTPACTPAAGLPAAAPMEFTEAVFAAIAPKEVAAPAPTPAAEEKQPAAVVTVEAAPAKRGRKAAPAKASKKEEAKKEDEVKQPEPTPAAPVAPAPAPEKAVEPVVEEMKEIVSAPAEKKPAAKGRGRKSVAPAKDEAVVAAQKAEEEAAAAAATAAAAAAAKEAETKAAADQAKKLSEQAAAEKAKQEEAEAAEAKGKKAPAGRGRKSLAPAKAAEPEPVATPAAAAAAEAPKKRGRPAKEKTVPAPVAVIPEVAVPVTEAKSAKKTAKQLKEEKAKEEADAKAKAEEEEAAKVKKPAAKRGRVAKDDAPAPVEEETKKRPGRAAAARK